jgi:putative zinc finger protein
MIDMRKLGMPSCEEASRLVSEAKDRPLSAGERWKMRFHLAMCRHCGRFEEQLRMLDEAIRKDKQG